MARIAARRLKSLSMVSGGDKGLKLAWRSELSEKKCDRQEHQARENGRVACRVLFAVAEQQMERTIGSVD